MLNHTDDNDSGSDTRPSRPIPTAVRLTELLLGLEDLAYECNVQEAISMLRRPKKAFLKARAQECRTQERQAVLGEYL